jgi:formylglycine-generating enzyme required for sulfatase activity
VRTWAARVACVTAVLGVAPACSDTAPARAQVVLVVDTDAHVVGELPSNLQVSPDSAIDTLRIEVFDDQNHEVDLRTFVVADPASWPLSFGIEPSAAFGSEVRVQILGFRSLFSASGTDSNGNATLDPRPEVTLDRLVALPLPSSGIEYVSVTIQTDCMGTPSSFGSPLTTCIDASQLTGDPHTGVTVSGTSPTAASSVGTWAPALEVPCNATPGAQQVCIPGGFFILGDLDAVGDGETMAYETVPLRPVIMSPFLLDEYEFTVGKFRQLLASGAFTGAKPVPTTPSDPYDQFCTWPANNDASHDDYPLNCVPYASAQALCALSTGGAGHGALPTEAQWEYAARGRGQRQRYPWGNVEPSCCSASIDRAGPPDVPTLCPGTGVEPVGSHPLAPSCMVGGVITGDVSRDGVFDMAGSLSEVLGDFEQAYSASCWMPPAILTDPSCQATNAASGQRGSNWNGGEATAFLPLRNSASSDGDPTTGFRCAYADTAP